MKSVMVFILILMVGSIIFYQPEVVVAQQPACTVLASDFISDCESLTFTLTGNGWKPGWIYYSLEFTPVSGGTVIPLNGFVQIIYLNGTPTPDGDENYEMTYTVNLPTGEFLLNGTFEIKLVDYVLSPSYGDDSISSVPVNTVCPPGCPGTGTPGYWKNHPDAWPVDCITVGGEEFCKEDAKRFMKEKKKDKTSTLLRALIAAQLNILIGTESGCVDATMEAAYAWLNEFPYGSKVKASSDAWKIGEPLYLTLDAYNNGDSGCALSRDLCEEPPPDDPPDTAEGNCDGKVTQLTLRYIGSTVDAWIEVNPKKGDPAFAGTVQPGEEFSFIGLDKKGTLGTEIGIYVNDELNTKIHTSCSRPIGPGLVSGDFEVIAGESRNGGALSPIVLAKRTVSAPDGITLSQNYPNPFNPVTTISFSLPRSSHVTLKIYNALGNEVATLVDRNEFAGYHSVMWDASEYSSGIYFYQLTAGSNAETKRLMLLK